MKQMAKRLPQLSCLAAIFYLRQYSAKPNKNDNPLMGNSTSFHHLRARSAPSMAQDSSFPVACEFAYRLTIFLIAASLPCSSSPNGCFLRPVAYEVMYLLAPVVGHPLPRYVNSRNLLPFL